MNIRKVIKRTFLIVLAIVGVFIVSILFYNEYVQLSIKVDNKLLSSVEVVNKFKPQSQIGRSPMIFLIHGFGGSPFDLRPLTDSLIKKDISFESILLPGHGGIPTNLEGITAEDWINFCLSEYKKLLLTNNEIIIVGFSMGGALASILASEKEPLKLILISPYFGISSCWNIVGNPTTLAEGFHQIIPYVKKYKIGQINYPEGLKNYIAYPYLPINSIHEVSIIGNIAFALADKIKCPTLIAHSTGDKVADYSKSNLFFENLSTTKKNFIKYEKSNHIILYDYDSYCLITSVIKFIENDNE